MKKVSTREETKRREKKQKIIFLILAVVSAIIASPIMYNLIHQVNLTDLEKKECLQLADQIWYEGGLKEYNLSEKRISVSINGDSVSFCFLNSKQEVIPNKQTLTVTYDETGNEIITFSQISIIYEIFGIIAGIFVLLFIETILYGIFLAIWNSKYIEYNDEDDDYLYYLPILQ